jgi:hypothetical protein
MDAGGHPVDQADTEAAGADQGTGRPRAMPEPLPSALPRPDPPRVERPAYRRFPDTVSG